MWTLQNDYQKKKKSNVIVLEFSLVSLPKNLW